MTVIIDYDAGNIRSVEKALQFLGENVSVTRKREEILRADRVILPGVGAFGDAMAKLRGYHLEEVIRDVIARGLLFWGSVWAFSFCLNPVRRAVGQSDSEFFRAGSCGYRKRKA